MGLLSSIEQAVVAKLGSQTGGALLGPIMNMLKPNNAAGAPKNIGGGHGGAVGGLAAIGGLAGLIQLFHSHGLTDIINSWIGTGPNKSITTDQLHQVLGDQHLAEISNQMGTTPDNALGHLQQILPNLIDRLTPNGQIPSEQELLTHLS